MATDAIRPPDQLQPPQQQRKKSGRIRPIGTVLAILAIYFGSLVGYFWLDRHAHEVTPGDLNTSSETVVLLEMASIHPLDNRVETNVLVIPEKKYLDEFGVLNTDITVRLYPSTDFGEINNPAGHTPQRTTTSMLATGDANRWPFDTYTTKTIVAEVFVGTGDARHYVPSRVEVFGSLYGWDIRADRSSSATNPVSEDDNATITFWRSRGPLALIIGICLVLVSLPALALFVAIEMLIGRKKFQPPFGTWFAAMLFSVVPIRSVLPGDPPPGSWVDEAIVLWVLIALAAAMVMYIVAWFKRAE